MKSVVALTGTVLVLLACYACGGSSNSYNSSPTSPTPTPTPGAMQIGIVGNLGAQSFTPNPATVAQGQMMTFKNNDGVTHRIVANDGSFDTGNIGGGGTSTAVMLNTNGANFHCSIHPGMVGSINASGGTPPPCTGQYCGGGGY